MKKKQKILLVHNYYKISGGEDSVVANEKKLLEEYGHEVVLYTRSNSEIDNFGLFKKIKFPFVSVYNRKTYREVKEIIKKEKIDIVHVHNTLSIISPSVYYAANKCGVPVIQTIHNFRMICPAATLYRDGHICEDCINQGFRCAIKYKCYRNSRLQTRVNVAILKKHRRKGIYQRINYICLTEFNKRKLLSYTALKPDQIYVKPNFSETEKKIIPFIERENQFIFVGRLDKLKGVDQLFHAWQKMENNASKLLICGTGPLEEWCKNFIAENNITNIEMVGFVENEKAKELIGHSKALILPTQLYEGFPMTIVEAFSVGTPVIGSDLGNTGDLIQEGVTGWKFNPSNCESIAVAVNNVSDIVDSVYKVYRENYTAEKNYELLKNIYDIVESGYRSNKDF